MPWLFFIVSLVVTLTSAVAQEPARIALLIGNQSYDASVGVLRNPHNDIRVVGAALRQQGFEVLPEVKDARRSTILGAVRQLRDRLIRAGTGAIGLVYYSGHGAAEADTGINYLIPVDAKKPGSDEFWDESLKLEDILKLLDGARGAAKFVIFDACRNELRVPAKSTTKGLIPIAEQQGMLIAYATSPGRTASDEGASSGPFAQALAAELAKPGLDHLNLFQNVKERVVDSTKGIQQPWIIDGLARRVAITQGALPGASAGSQAPKPRVLEKRIVPGTSWSASATLEGTDFVSCQIERQSNSAELRLVIGSQGSLVMILQDPYLKNQIAESLGWDPGTTYSGQAFFDGKPKQVSVQRIWDHSLLVPLVEMDRNEVFGARRFALAVGGIAMRGYDIDGATAASKELNDCFRRYQKQ